MKEVQDPIKPFIKWAGGKTQMLDQIALHYPIELLTGQIKNYYEPFLGGGACFLTISNKFNFDKVILSDINHELIIAYKVVQKDVCSLIEYLVLYKKKYLSLNEKQKEEYYYDMRVAYNLNRFSINYNKYNDSWISRAAQLIFLNKTCFNGLFRINQKGDFNVPFGKRYNPKIFDETNLMKISKNLQNSEIVVSDFSKMLDDVENDSFVFLDPPYRPLFKSTNFTSYTKHDFKEKDQIRLAIFMNALSNKGVKVMLTNSDPENETTTDSFFEDHYSNFNIRKIQTSRMINNNSGNRNILNDLLITNY